MLDFDWLLKTGPCKKYLAGQLIPYFSDDNPSERAMYLLIGGGVDVKEDGKRIASVSKGGVFGGREFFTGVIGDAVCTAGVDSVVYIITESSFNQLARSRPEVLFDVMRAAYSDKGPEANAQDAVALEIAEGGIFPPGHKSYPGVTKPEYVKLVFSKEYDCPFCKKKFTDFKVARSKLYQSAPIRYDLRRFYTGFQTEWYDVITCPHCYFSVYHTYYTEPKPLLKNAIEKNLAAARTTVTLDFYAERSIDFVFTSHYLALLCSTGYVPTGRQLRARLWGNISWLYEDVKDEEMMRFAAAKTAEAYESVYMESTLTPTQEQVTCLTIAGMMHRAGRDDNLKKYLFTAKTIKGGDKSYTKMADDMMDMLRME